MMVELSVQDEHPSTTAPHKETTTSTSTKPPSTQTPKPNGSLSNIGSPILTTLIMFLVTLLYRLQ